MRQTSPPSAPIYAPTPKRVAPRRSAPTTTAAADRAPRTPPTAPATVSGVPPIPRPIAPPRTAPTTAAAPIPSTFVPRIPVLATEAPSTRPRQHPSVYQLPMRRSVERGLGRAFDPSDHSQPERGCTCAVHDPVVERE